MPESRMPLDLSGDLGYFDEGVFLSEIKDEQDVCSFVLMLALAYNDLKDILRTLDALEKWKIPPPSPPYSQGDLKYFGEIGGMREHAIRLLYGNFCELTKSISENIKVIDLPLFKKVLGLVNKESLAHWESLVRFSKEQPDENFREILERIRNGITYHYHQPKRLLRGYKFFISSEIGDSQLRKPHILRGSGMSSTRFYFADMATQGCFQKLIKELNCKAGENISEMARDVSFSLFWIVERFCQMRSGGYRKYA